MKLNYINFPSLHFLLFQMHHPCPKTPTLGQVFLQFFTHACSLHRIQHHSLLHHFFPTSSLSTSHCNVLNFSFTSTATSLCPLYNVGFHEVHDECKIFLRSLECCSSNTLIPQSNCIHSPRVLGINTSLLPSIEIASWYSLIDATNTSIFTMFGVPLTFHHVPIRANLNDVASCQFSNPNVVLFHTLTVICGHQQESNYIVTIVHELPLASLRHDHERYMNKIRYHRRTLQTGVCFVNEILTKSSKSV